jgi:hypothetical protein
MKTVFIMLFSTLCLAFFGQTESPNPYELYWKRYVIEHTFEEIKSNQVRSVTVYDVELNKGKEKRKNLFYSIDFDSIGNPIKFIHQTQFSLRKDFQYNPIWRARNDFPVFYIKEYKLNYNGKNQLVEVIESEKMTNSKIVQYHKLGFDYDSLNRLSLIYKCDLSYFSHRKLDTVFQYPTDSAFIIYLTNKNGLILTKPKYGVKDTIEWKNSPIQLIEFWFGDSTQPQLKNIPIDRNTSMYFALDKGAKISYNLRGLIEKKEPNLPIPENEIVHLKNYSYLRYVYKYYNDTSTINKTH